MAVSKDDTVLTYSKFKEFWTSFAVLFNKKLDGSGIKNNDTTTDSGYVLDARVGKVHGDEIDTLKDQMNGCYIAYDADGKLGIKVSKNGAVQRFRQPTGTATAAQVLSGATFANASNDNLTGTMPNNGAINKTLTPSGNNTTSVTIPAGYTTGGTITANGAAAYAAGKDAGKAIVTETITITIPKSIVGQAGGDWVVPFNSEDAMKNANFTQTANVLKSGYTAVSVGISYINSRGYCHEAMTYSSVIVGVALTSANTVTLQAATSDASNRAMPIPITVTYVPD